LLLNASDRLVVFIDSLMPLEPAELVLRMKEHRYYVGRTQIGLSVVLIELLLAKIDTGLKVGGVGCSDLILRRLEVREDEVHASKDFM
jgi:hypothetical protein